MFSFRPNDNQKDQVEDKGELEQFFEDEDWDIGQKGGEVFKEEDQDIDWSNYDFMHTFDDVSNDDSNDSEDDTTK